MIDALSERNLVVEGEVTQVGHSEGEEQRASVDELPEKREPSQRSSTA